jgi:AcrR family transcriptional regulator
VRTREALRQALLNLLVTKSLDQISIRDIAKEADIGYRTFFRHHATKESVLHDVAAEQIQRLLSFALPAVVAGNNRAGSIALCRYVDEHRALWSILLTGGASGAMREEFVRLASSIAPPQRSLERWLPPDIGVILGITATIELLAWWLRQKQPLSVERVAEIHDRMVVTPIVDGGAAGRLRAARGLLDTDATDPAEEPIPTKVDAGIDTES